MKGEVAKKPPDVDLVRPLARRTSVVAAIAAIILTLGTPLSLYRWNRGAWQALGASYANRMAGLVRDVVVTQPDLWYYDAPKLANHLHLLVQGPDVARVVVIDGQGRRLDVPERGEEGWLPVLWWAQAPVYRGHEEVAQVWVAIDATGGLARVLISLLLALALGATLSTVLYIVPVAVVRRAQDRLNLLLRKLRGAHGELEILNSELEERVEKRSQQLAETAEALRGSEAQLREVAGRAVEATEQERQRVASELHDGAGQMLTGIRLSLQVLGTALSDDESDSAARSRLGDVEGLVDDSIDEVRRIAMALHPAALDRLGLVRGLRELCSSVGTQTDMAVIFESAALPDQLSAAVESSCYRLVQECLTNIVRYAEAESVEVTLRVGNNDDELRVKVKDDGKGFDTEAAHGGLGLRGMRDRAALLGGTLTVESVKGRGTTVEATLPRALGAQEGESE